MSPTDTRTLLLETALNLIWNSNYTSVGVNEICKQAGVTKGSFYHHFESKAELFCEATSHYWEEIRQELDCIFSPINSPLEQLENWLQFIYINKVGEDKDNVPGCAFFTAGMQSGCGENRITDTLQLMTDRISNIKKDLPEGIYRILGLKPEFWYSAKPTWPCTQEA
ncbi:MAG: TetR/AcrR family transcriptional regulator [Cellvibrio sp.]|nr:TetR/AcrR family transcriptional regulator [Cellvibrio sp.]